MVAISRHTKQTCEMARITNSKAAVLGIIIQPAFVPFVEVYPGMYFSTLRTGMSRLSDLPSLNASHLL